MARLIDSNLFMVEINFNFYSLPPLISSVLFLILGAYVLFNNPKLKLNIFFGLICLATFWWQFAWFLLFNTQEMSWALTLIKSGYIGILLIPVFFFHFFIIFLKSENFIDKFLLFISYAATVFFEVILLNTNFLINGFYEFFWGFYPRAGIIHPLYLLLLAILTLRAIFLFLINFKKDFSGSINYFQKKYLLIGFIFYFFSASDFLVNYGIEFYPFGFIFIIFFLAVTAYAITRYHLFRAEVVLTEFLTGIMGVILLALPFFMPSMVLKILTLFVFFLFSFFGYYLVKSAKSESRRREDAETIASRERILRREAEILAADLKRLDTAKTQFLLSTQHHLRSPLSVIQGYLSMIGEGSYGKIPKKAKEKIDASLEADRKLIHLVDELLDVAHFQMNKGAAAKEPVNVVDLIAGAIDDLKTAAAAKELYLNFKKPSVPIPLVSLNARGIREAIYNIVDNAIKYTQTGGIAVSMSVVGDQLRISVKDTGIGIDEKDLQGLFGRIFERGEKAKSVNIDGKGIGLYLSAQIIINNGGNIRVESKGLGEGSEFIIDLPMQTEG